MAFDVGKHIGRSGGQTDAHKDSMKDGPGFAARPGVRTGGAMPGAGRAEKLIPLPAQASMMWRIWV